MIEKSSEVNFLHPINNLTRKQLLGKCRDLHGICYSTKNKSELIKIIENKVSNIIVDTKIDWRWRKLTSDDFSSKIHYLIDNFYQKKRYFFDKN